MARKLLVHVHVIATVALLGADLALLVLGLAALRGSPGLYPGARLIAAWLIAPLAVASLATGVALALTSRWGLLRHAWVTIKLGITAVLTGLVLLVLLPALGAAAADPGELAGPERLRLALAPAGASALLTVNVLLARVKPRWRRKEWNHAR